MTEAQVPKGASDEMGYYARIEQFVSAEIPRELYIRSVIPRNEALPKSQILRFTEKAIQLARRTVPRYSSKFSKHRYTLPCTA